MDNKQSKAKRIFDICFSSIVFILGWPIFILIALLVKCTSEGPCFYRSVRIGLFGKKFTCWKFRTMHKEAELMLKNHLEQNPLSLLEWQNTYKLKNDIRITKIGKWLRRSSLDELPQFWNVLKGDLSVVGPRPVTEEEAKLFLEKKGNKMFSIRPGLTGLWQTSGRSNLSYNERLDLEEKYINTRSFTLDLILILKTIPLMIFPKGAF